MVPLYAVMGNPISHSLSPVIHADFGKQFGIELRYEAILVPAGDLADAIALFRQRGGLGFNVTVPFKEEVLPLLDELTSAATLAGAVNTVTCAPGQPTRGDNTDGVGFMHDVGQCLGPVRGLDILVVGAGGAARGILPPLLSAKPASVTVCNRTHARAQQLLADLRASDPQADATRLVAVPMDELLGRRFNFLVNTTSAGLADTAPALPDGILAADGWAYDLMYSAKPSPFLRWANQQGAARSADGLGMLVEQAAAAFSIWTGKVPQTRTVIEALRQRLNG